MFAESKLHYSYIPEQLQHHNTSFSSQKLRFFSLFFALFFLFFLISVLFFAASCDWDTRLNLIDAQFRCDLIQVERQSWIYLYITVSIFICLYLSIYELSSIKRIDAHFTENLSQVEMMKNLFTSEYIHTNLFLEIFFSF